MILAEASRPQDWETGMAAGASHLRPVASQDAIASMRRHGIAFTADNYAVWHCYLSGSNPAVKRAIDIVLSNGLAVEERTLRVLYARHFCPAREALALRELTARAFQTVAALNTAPDPLLATELLARLGRDMAEMVRQSDQMTRLLGQSEERIAQLERFLDDARKEASTDGLTGIANRRAFDAALRALAGDSMNDGSELAVVLIDIDHFKLVNDRHGHPVGDEVLRMIAATLTATIRGKDMVARFGGEEFAVILPATDRAGALAAGENLRWAIEQQALQLQARGAPVIRVTISAGVSSYDHGEALGDWLTRADGALYEAKQGGRNRVAFGEIVPLVSNVVTLGGRG